MKNRFTRSLRLVKKKQFENVFEKPQKISSSLFNVFYCKNDCNKPRIGIVVQKKKVSNAVTRNRIKRQVRNSFRLNKNKIGNFDIVILSKIIEKDFDNENIKKCLEFIWKKLK